MDVTKLDWRHIKGETSPSDYGPGVHHVKFGEWKFDETKNGKVYLQIDFDRVDAMDGDKPFTNCRLYFTTERAVTLARHYLHALCDKMKIEYTEEKVATGEAILQLGEELKGRAIDIELKPTGSKSQKGYDYLGVSIEGVGDLFIKQKDQTVSDQEIPRAEYITDEELNEALDIPF